MLLERPEAAAWLDSLRAVTLAECAAAKRAAEEGWKRPLAERLATGRALAGLRIVKQTHDKIVFEPTGEDQSPCFLREGDLVRLSHDNPAHPIARLTLGVEDHEGLHATIRKAGATYGDQETWTLDADFIDLSDRLLDALEALATSPRLLDLLTGKLDAGIDLDLAEACAEELEDSAFNPTQVDAIAACVAARDAFLIQGPPGTGKTRVLAETAARLLRRGESLLVTGPTHRAIDHALSTIRRAVDDDVRIVKIGHRSVGELRGVERFDRFRESRLSENAEPYVVGATPFALWSKNSGLYSARFDSVLLDEASQIVPLQAAMAMLRGERWLFFGDDRQLPPVILNGDGVPPKMRSIFALLRDRDMDLMLEESYRLSEALAGWPSATFYGNRLRGKHRFNLRLQAGQIPSELSPEPALAVRVIPSPGSTVINDAEAEAARDLAKALVDGGINPANIGIVTPFRAQAGRIRQLLRLAFPGSGGWKEITVDTVERFQGQEREVMVVALTASDCRFIERLADFLFQPERLNVAVTRARLKTVLLVPAGLAAHAAHLADRGHPGATVCCSLLSEVRT
jgi:DNA replication ATP-dependent helicase Dna2